VPFRKYDIVRVAVALFLLACGARSELDVEAGATDAALGQDADDAGQGAPR